MPHDHHDNALKKRSNSFIDEKTFLSISAMNFLVFDFTFYLIDFFPGNGRVEFNSVYTPLLTLTVISTFFLVSIFHGPRITGNNERQFYWFADVFLSISLIAVFLELYRVNLSLRFFMETFKMVFLSLTLTRLYLYLPELFYDRNKIFKALLATAAVAALFGLYLTAGSFIYNFCKNLY